MSNVIYRIKNVINNKVYIGQTVNFKNRKISHIFNVKNGSNFHIYYAMRKYGIKNFIFEEIFSVFNENDMNDIEIQFIAEYNSYNNGYNMTTGGNALRGKNHPSYGKHPSEETRKKQSNNMKGKRIGKLHPLYGKTGKKSARFNTKHSEVTKAIMRKPHPTTIGKLHPKFTGYYHTPFGRLDSSYEINKYTTVISDRMIRKYCKEYSDKTIIKMAIQKSKYLTENMLGKTYREIGFWFEPIKKSL